MHMCSGIETRHRNNLVTEYYMVLQLQEDTGLPIVRDNPAGCSKIASSSADQKVKGVISSPFRPRIDKQPVIAHSRKILVLFNCTDLDTLKQFPTKEYGVGTNSEFWESTQESPCKSASCNVCVDIVSGVSKITENSSVEWHILISETQSCEPQQEARAPQNAFGLSLFH